MESDGFKDADNLSRWYMQTRKQADKNDEECCRIIAIILEKNDRLTVDAYLEKHVYFRPKKNAEHHLANSLVRCIRYRGLDRLEKGQIDKSRLMAKAAIVLQAQQAFAEEAAAELFAKPPVDGKGGISGLDARYDNCGLLKKSKAQRNAKSAHAPEISVRGDVEPDEDSKYAAGMKSLLSHTSMASFTVDREMYPIGVDGRLGLMLTRREKAGKYSVLAAPEIEKTSKYWRSLVIDLGIVVGGDLETTQSGTEQDDKSR